ncbi:hypothetical protein [Listeria booriae]|uniref:Uncharacterized protein n=1 Tax=Listeria booriae TaxID=1552123 RepID=A0A7X1DL60_9LIST|nr:hypothetical protein [Listeria booriae]MBC2284339.1 hypothetical protein [Listeria booriae]MBC2292739.1 hypothetical protein [Listeria booriae]MBC2304000.1 hypothetical protein [Listeria booriae]MBC2311816.1 hypothetical protein [Listeria booriae]MBC2320407.1 hypothetical protein [Listeria booriae]
MSLTKIFSGIFLVVYGVIFINIIYNILQTKTGFGFPIWIQIVLGACFLVMTLSNFKQSHYVFGGIFASAVVLVAVSVVMTSIT